MMIRTIVAVTNWWANDATFKNARLIGHIHSHTTYSRIEPLS